MNTSRVGWDENLLLARESVEFVKGDYERGKRIFVRLCANCHTVGKGEPHLQGPNLHGLIGRRYLDVPGYQRPEYYTGSNRPGKYVDFVWDKFMLSEYLKCPRQCIPGISLLTEFKIFGIYNKQQRADLLTYLKENK